MKLAVIACLLLGACIGAEELDPAAERAPIVGGSTTTGDPAVVELSIIGGEGGASCSGTLISKRVVLTAAHCLDMSGGVDSVSAYFGSTHSGTDPAFVESIPAVEWEFYSPWSLSANDLGLVLLEREALTAPRPINRTALSTGDIGDPIRLVGWGITSGSGSGAGTKRQVTSSLTGFYNSKVLAYGSASANTCSGDSGGPGFMNIGGTEVIASITSFGNGSCTGDSGGTRVAKYAGWIDSWVATHDVVRPPEVNITRPENGATVGDFFVVQAEASDDIRVDKVELFVNGSPMGSSITAPYVFNVQGLPDGTAQIEARATDSGGSTSSAMISVTVSTECNDCPTPGEFGASCVANAECVTGLCAQVGDDQYCTDWCDVEANDCPDGFDCAPAGDSGACVRADGGDNVDDAAGGCSTGGHGGPAWLLLLALVALRRVYCRRGGR